MDERELPADDIVMPGYQQNQRADAAFSAFYRRFVPSLVGFLVWQGARLADAIDIAQETMIKMYTYWSGLQEPEAWALRNGSRTWARKIASVNEESADKMVARSSLLPINQTAWEQQYEVLRLLGPLPSRQRQVLAWKLEGYTLTEIASELKIVEEVVRTNLEEARATLAKHIGITEDGQ